MSDITITTDGTLEGTKLSVDGKEVTKKEKVVSIDMYASASWKGKYSGENYPGGAAVSYTTVDDDGKKQVKTFGQTDTKFSQPIGQKMKTEDSVIRYLGETADANVTTLADKIISHCDENKISCPDRDALLCRTISSLTDKAIDLGITIEE